MAQFTESSDLASENGDVKQLSGMLVPREAEIASYTALGAPMLPPVWQDQQASGMSLTKMAHSFRRRWLLALFMGLLLGIPAALATWVIFPKQFEVTAMLQFRNVEEFVGGVDGHVDPQTVKQFRETQLHLIRSAGILTAAIRDPKIASLPLLKAEDEPIYFLQKSLDVFSPRDSDLIVIKMKGEDDHQMVEIVKAITDKYIAHATDQAKTDRNRKIEIIDRRLKQTDTELVQKRQDYVNLSLQIGAVDSKEIEKRRNLIEAEIHRLNSKLTVLETEKLKAEQEVVRLTERQRAIADGEYPEELLLEGFEESPRMINLQERMSQISELLQEQRAAAKDPQRDPSVHRTLRTLQNLKEEEEQLKTAFVRNAMAKLKWGGNDRLEDSLPAAKIRGENLAADVTKVEDEIKELKTNLLNLSKDSADLAQKKAEIEQLQESSRQLARRNDEAFLRLGAPPPVVVIEPAELPEGSTLTYRIILTSFLGLVCFCVGVGGVVLLEYTKQRVSSLNEIGYGGLGIRVLGTVPNLARISRQSNGSANGSVSGILAESIDSVRTMLLSNKRADAPKVILVTSADEHEGKTTVATHLAASLARAGRRTLLIDGDLRKPSVHMLFDMPLSAGLCEVLRGEAEVDTVVHPAQVEGMWLMLAGQCDGRAIAALAKEAAEAVFRTLRADYDFVVIDSGPALAYADTMLMGNQADAAVMAILRDVSQIPKVYEARERLEAIGLPVLGGVVGGVSAPANRNYALLN